MKTFVPCFFSEEGKEFCINLQVFLLKDSNKSLTVRESQIDCLH